MTKRTRRNHSPAFKAKVALAALKGKRRWPIWRSNMMSTSIRSHNGEASFPMARRRSGGTRRSIHCSRVWLGLTDGLDRPGSSVQDETPGCVFRHVTDRGLNQRRCGTTMVSPQGGGEDG
jgi:hypothetical protein